MSHSPAAVSSQRPPHRRAHRAFSARWLSALAGVAVLVLAGLTGWPNEAHARSAALSGTWSGGGVMRLNSGAQERVRCRVRYFRQSGTTFSMNARCASGAGRLTQSGSLVRTSANKYQGTVYNPQYGVTATVYVTVKGRRQSVYISSIGGTGSFSLRKR